MHAVLHLQTDRTNAQQNQPFKQRLCQTRLGGFLAHHDRPQLAVITNQHELLDTQHNRNKALGLHGLRRLVNQQLAEAQIC